jgi:hypothetical protein
MISEKQIRAAVKLLGGRGREDVVRAIGLIDYQNTNHEQLKTTKQYKIALEALRRALRRARVAHDKVSWRVRSNFSDRQTHEKVHSPDLVEKYVVVRELGSELERYEKLCEQLILDAPTTKPKRDGFRKRLAVDRAYYLLCGYGYEPITTRTGQWCRLAAILCGDPDANLYRYCCEHLKERQQRQAQN